MYLSVTSSSPLLAMGRYKVKIYSSTKSGLPGYFVLEYIFTLYLPIASNGEELVTKSQYEICSRSGTPTNYSVSRIFKDKIFIQQGYSVSRDIPVQIIQSVGKFQYKTFSQQGYSSTNYSVKYETFSQQGYVPVQNIQSVGIYSRPKQSVRKAIPVLEYPYQLNILYWNIFTD